MLEHILAHRHIQLYQKVSRRQLLYRAVRGYLYLLLAPDILSRMLQGRIHLQREALLLQLIGAAETIHLHSHNTHTGKQGKDNKEADSAGFHGLRSYKVIPQMPKQVVSGGQINASETIARIRRVWKSPADRVRRPRGAKRWAVTGRKSRAYRARKKP